MKKIALVPIFCAVLLMMLINFSWMVTHPTALLLTGIASTGTASILRYIQLQIATVRQPKQNPLTL